jgi:hypothetical protein
MIQRIVHRPGKATGRCRGSWAPGESVIWLVRHQERLSVAGVELQYSDVMSSG